MLKDELEAVISSDNIWAGRSTLVLALGILGEYVLLPFLEDTRHWKKGAKVACAVLVVLGIVGEYGFSSRIAQNARLLQTIADQELADAVDKAGRANERAAANEKEAARLRKEAEQERMARVKIEEATAWRRLTDKHRTGPGSRLSAFAGQFAFMQYNMNDIEAFGFATDIATWLRFANWQTTEPLAVIKAYAGPVPFGTNPPLERGVVIVSTGDKRSRDAADTVRDELVASGFDCTRQSRIESRPTPTVFVGVEPRPEGPQGQAKLRKLNKQSTK